MLSYLQPTAEAVGVVRTVRDKESVIEMVGKQLDEMEGILSTIRDVTVRKRRMKQRFPIILKHLSFDICFSLPLI